MTIPFKEDKLIISLYDYTGQWAKPYIDAGYPVLLWDKKIEGDIFERGFGHFQDYIKPFNPDGYELYGILAAPPCTDFAVSGARHFKSKDKSTQRCGGKDDEAFDNSVDMHIGFVAAVMFMVEMFEPKFWVIENPVGRVERLVPELKPFRKLLFNPCDYGDPYTKKTILWGEFNSDLKKNEVEPVMYENNGKKGSYMWAKLGGKSEKTKALRSATPKGFAQAFFEANQ